MTTLDLTADPTFLGLCAAVDDGDDSALPILADRLEDLGDARAEGLRELLCDGRSRAGECRPIHSLDLFTHPSPTRIFLPGDAFAWHRQHCRNGHQRSRGWAFRRRCIMPDHVYDRLGMQGDQAVYPTRSAAFLALAEALISQ